MIDRAIDVLFAELKTFLAGKFRPTAGNEVIELGNVHDLTKDPDAETLRLTLVRIEEERTFKTQTATRRLPDQRIEQIEPDLKLNLYLLVSGYTKHYAGGLKQLAAVIGFFQAHPVFNAANTPALDPGIEKLLVELHSPSFEELNFLFGMLTSGYRPSALYKVRMVVIQDSAARGVAPPVLSAGWTGVRA